MPPGDPTTDHDRPPPSDQGPTGIPAAEIAILSGLAAAHVLDHRVVPKRVHVATHLTTAAAAIGAALAAGATVDDLGLSPGRARAGLRRGAIVSTGLLAAIGLAALWPRTRHVFDDERVRDATASSIAFRGLIEIPLGTALSEELIFRGALLGLARRRLGPAAATGATSALFGLWHVMPSLADRDMNPLTDARPAPVVVGTTVVFTAVAGAMFAYERLVTGSVLAPIMTHTTTNVGTLIVAHLVHRRHQSQDQPEPEPEPESESESGPA